MSSTVEIPPPLPGCGTLSNLLNLSMPLFSEEQKGRFDDLQRACDSAWHIRSAQQTWAVVLSFSLSNFFRIRHLKDVTKVFSTCFQNGLYHNASLPGFSGHGILQVRILEWVAMPFSRGSSRPRDRSTSPTAPALAGGFFTTSATWEAH